MEYITECPSCGSSFFRQLITVRAHMHPYPRSFHFVRCDLCSLVFLNPRVPPTELGDFYRDHYLPYRGPSAWGRFSGLVETSLGKTDRKRVNLVKHYARPGSSAKVMDVGCGKPSFLEKLTEKTGCRGLGIDFTDSGWKDEPERWKKLDLRVVDIHDPDLEGPVDVITMWHYLEHDYRPRMTLERLLDLSHSHTTLFIEVPDFRSFTRKWHGPWWEGYHSPRHTAVYEPSTMASLLQHSGWEPVKILSYGSLDPYTIHWMSRMERKGIMDESNEICPGKQFKKEFCLHSENLSKTGTDAARCPHHWFRCCRNICCHSSGCQGIQSHPV